jgi:galactokinase/mevalonate kinase-like predicted kinase
MIEENLIIEFLKEQQPQIITKAPARINLINPLDAVEADFWAPSMAISSKENPLSCYCYVKSNPDELSSVIFYEIKEEAPQNRIVVDSSEDFDLHDLFNASTAYDYHTILGSLKYLFKLIPEFNILEGKQVEIGLITTIPRQSGIGGSSSMIIALMWAIGCYCGFDQQNPSFFANVPFNRDVMGELSTEAENLILKNTAGYGDRYTISRGGIGFASYVGKLNHPRFGNGPLAVYDRIENIYQIRKMPIILAFSGVQHSSGNIHEVLRKCYLDGDPVLKKYYEDLSDISWKSRHALMKHDWRRLGKLFNENATYSEKIMTHCGFKYGIGWANRVLIDAIKDQPDVYAIKLSGAGGGGSVFALVKPGKEKKIKDVWQQKIADVLNYPSSIQAKFPDLKKSQILQLVKAQFFEIDINLVGVQKLKIWVEQQ